jgi:hypothetical protein
MDWIALTSLLPPEMIEIFTRPGLYTRQSGNKFDPWKQLALFFKRSASLWAMVG